VSCAIGRTKQCRRCGGGFDLDLLFGAASGLQPRKGKSGAGQMVKVATGSEPERLQESDEESSGFRGARA
jgi:hypothetical protein